MTARTKPPMVGRESELAELEEALPGAATGTSAVLVVAGEAGIGKTRLVGEAADRARTAGSRVLVGSCLDLGEGRIPFAPVTQMLRTLAQQTDRSDLDRLLGPLLDELSRLSPDLAGDEGFREPRAEVSGQAGRARLFEAILGAVERLGRDRPLLLLFEDVHWIDDATRDVLTFLVRNLSGERVLIIATYRTHAHGGTPMDAYLADLERAPLVRRLDLQPLGRTDTQALIAEFLGELPDEDVSRRIDTLAGGNPLFIEELLAAWQSGTTDLPGTLREIVLGPVERLSAPARRVVDVVAVAGHPLDDRILGPATELDGRRLLESLREAVGGRVLASTRTGYIIRHVLIGDAVLDDLLPVERRRIHERLAEIIAAAPESESFDPATLARHWAEADRPAEALAASIDAATAAYAVYAFDDALRQYQLALELWERAPVGARAAIGRVELLRRAAEAANLAGEVRRATRFVEIALSACDDTDVVMRGILHSQMGYLQWQAGKNDAAIASFEEAVRLVPREPATIERAGVLSGLAGGLMVAGRYRESAAVANEAIEAAQAAGSLDEEARGLGYPGSDLVSLGDNQAGLEHLEAALELVASRGPIDARILALYNLAFALEQSDLLNDALRVATEGMALVRGSGLERRFGTMVRALAGECLYRLGRWDEADAITGEALTLNAAPEEEVFLRCVRAELLIGRGETEGAKQALDEASKALSTNADPDIQAAVAARQAELALHQREWEDGRRAVKRGLAALGVGGLPSLTAVLQALDARIEAECFTEAGIRHDERDAEAARQRAAVLGIEIASALARDGMSRTARAWLETASAELAIFSGPLDAGAWLQLADTWDAIPMPFPAAYARFRETSARLATDQGREVAASSLARAYLSARSLGAAPLSSAIEGLARRARIDLPSEAASEPELPGTPARSRSSPSSGLATSLGLSVREVEVLRLLTQGRTNGQIASELFISPKTASVHVTHILTKLGVTNRVEAAMIAARAGLSNQGEAGAARH